MQVTIILDSGTFLDNDDPAKYEIGYFEPTFVIHGDGEELETIYHPGADCPSDATRLPSLYKELHFRHLEASGKDRATGVSASQCLIKGILRLEKLYGQKVEVDPAGFDCIFSFNSGLFCCSKPKIRKFKEIDATTKIETLTKIRERIPHDLLVMYELGAGETLTLFCGTTKVWSTGDYPQVQKRFDIDVIADHATAYRYYCDVVKADRHYIPNQGDPPPDSTGGRP